MFGINLLVNGKRLIIGNSTGLKHGHLALNDHSHLILDYTNMDDYKELIEMAKDPNYRRVVHMGTLSRGYNVKVNIALPPGVCDEIKLVLDDPVKDQWSVGFTTDCEVPPDTEDDSQTTSDTEDDSQTTDSQTNDSQTTSDTGTDSQTTSDSDQVNTSDQTIIKASQWIFMGSMITWMMVNIA